MKSFKQFLKENYELENEGYTQDAWDKLDSATKSQYLKDHPDSKYNAKNKSTPSSSSQQTSSKPEVKKEQPNNTNDLDNFTKDFIQRQYKGEINNQTIKSAYNDFMNDYKDNMDNYMDSDDDYYLAKAKQSKQRAAKLKSLLSNAPQADKVKMSDKPQPKSDIFNDGDEVNMYKDDNGYTGKKYAVQYSDADGNLKIAGFDKPEDAEDVYNKILNKDKRALRSLK